MATSRTFKFTTPTLAALEPLGSGERFVVRDSKQPGLELRVTKTGAKTYSVRRRIKGGKVERVTIGTFPEMTPEVARDKAKVITGQHAQGISNASVKRKQARDGKTFGEALTEFIDDDSGRDNPLKPRTRLDYLNMIRPAGKATNGRQHGAGELHALCEKRIDGLTGTTLKAHYKRLSEKSQTRAGYAMRVARAVLKYQGVRMDDDPFDLATARRDRIVIPASKRRTRTIPFERLGEWWRAAAAVQTGDAFQLLLLTGMRRGELSTTRRSEVDLKGGRIHLRDTKNRHPHTVLLSKQALELVRARAANLKPDDILFAGGGDPRKSLQSIIAATGIEFSAHDCRRTFATVAASRLPGYVVKRLMNHAAGNDVTAAHYVHLDEATLRAGWQVVADAIVPRSPISAVATPTRDKVVSLAARRSANSG